MQQLPFCSRQLPGANSPQLLALATASFPTFATTLCLNQTLLRSRYGFAHHDSSGRLRFHSSASVQSFF